MMISSFSLFMMVRNPLFWLVKIMKILLINMMVYKIKVMFLALLTVCKHFGVKYANLHNINKILLIYLLDLMNYFLLNLDSNFYSMVSVLDSLHVIISLLLTQKLSSPDQCLNTFNIILWIIYTSLMLVLWCINICPNRNYAKLAVDLFKNILLLMELFRVILSLISWLLLNSILTNNPLSPTNLLYNEN